MRTGESYYEAMDQALRATNGPPKSGRAFREPMIFELWRVLPSERAIWMAFACLACLAGIAIAFTSDAPLIAPFVTFYVLKSARLDQHLLVEIWTGPVLVLAIASWRMRWYRAAAAIAVAAVLIRELALLLIVGGLLQRRERKPWLVALVVSLIGVGVHLMIASGHTSPTGSEASLFGTGGVERMLDMAGVGFNNRAAAGLVLWSLAWFRVLSDRDLARFAGPMLAMPVLGLLVGRDYWGFVVVPVTLLFAMEGAWSLVGSMRRSLAPTAATPGPDLHPRSPTAGW
jgi:hypothetical protein